jgi:hypothetical protein
MTVIDVREKMHEYLRTLGLVSGDYEPSDPREENEYDCFR